MKLVSIVAAIAVSGCATAMDLSYLVSDRRYDDHRTVREPTKETTSAIEYEFGENETLTCTNRTRRVERKHNVHRTFKRNGGYSRGAYHAAAVLDGVVAGIVGAVILALCLSEPKDRRNDQQVSCSNTLWAAPFALDLGYAIFRGATVKPAVLIDKSHGQDSTVLSEKAIDETPTQCESVASVALGKAVGPRGIAGGESSQRLGDGAITIAQQPDGRLSFDTDALSAWANDSSLRVFVVAQDGALAELEIARCTLLRSKLPQFPREDLAVLNQTCPPPEPSK